MGRVSQARAAENRERVVAAASRLFRERGVENVSIADVMAEAGLTVGAFYKQFDSKEALVSEAFARAFDDAAGVWSAVTKKSPSVDALVEHYLSPRPAQYNLPDSGLCRPCQSRCVCGRTAHDLRARGGVILRPVLRGCRGESRRRRRTERRGSAGHLRRDDRCRLTRKSRRPHREGHRHPLRGGGAQLAGAAGGPV